MEINAKAEFKFLIRSKQSSCEKFDLREIHHFGVCLRNVSAKNGFSL